MNDVLKKIDAVLKYEGKIHQMHLNEAYRLQRRMAAMGTISVMEEMELDSIMEIYDIEVESENI